MNSTLDSTHLQQAEWELSQSKDFLYTMTNALGRQYWSLLLGAVFIMWLLFEKAENWLLGWSLYLNILDG